MNFRNSANQPVVYNGEDITWRVSAYGVVINFEGKMLLIKASHNNMWQVPGGMVEMHESVFEGIHREGIEETGYDISVSNTTPIAFSEDYFFHEGKKRYFKTLQLYFYAKLNSEERDLSHMDDYDSLGKIEWVDLSELTEANTQVTLWPVIVELKKQRD
jgi:8-oxo-dGTP pyrophosphatase MutT (NUDIX family)